MLISEGRASQFGHATEGVVRAARSLLLGLCHHAESKWADHPLGYQQTLEGSQLARNGQGRFIHAMQPESRQSGRALLEAYSKSLRNGLPHGIAVVQFLAEMSVTFAAVAFVRRLASDVLAGALLPAMSDTVALALVPTRLEAFTPAGQRLLAFKHATGLRVSQKARVHEHILSSEKPGRRGSVHTLDGELLQDQASSWGKQLAYLIHGLFEGGDMVQCV